MKKGKVRMVTSKPFLLMCTLKSIWESHEINAGRKYVGGGRDLRAAKNWIELNGLPGEDVTDIVARFNRFTENVYWLERGLPLYGFLESYADFDSPRDVPVKVKVVPMKVKGSCSYCQSEWWGPADAKCPKCYPNQLRLAQ